MTRNKKIIFLISTLEIGGAQKVILEIAKYLASKEKIDVHVISIYKRGELVHEDISPAKFHFLEENLKRFVIIRALPKLFKIIWQIKPDTVISTLLTANILNLICGCIFIKRYRVLVREANTPSVYNKCVLKNKSIWPKVFKYLLRFSDQVIAPSNGVKSDFANYYNYPQDKITVINNPINLKKIKQLAEHPPSFPLPAKYILGVGRLTQAKGFDILIQAYAKLENKDEIKLVILGEGPDRKKLEELVERLNLNNQVLLPGLVENPFPVYKSAELFVLSSRWEGSPNVLIQALALEVRSISTDCPSGPRELLPSNFLTPIDDVNILASLIKSRLQENDQNSIELKDFDLPTVVTKWLATINQK